MGRTPVVLAGLALLLPSACAREVTPGVAHERARAAEVREQGRDVEIARYHDAVRHGALGAVRGRVYEERRKPDASDVPLGGTVLMILPRSEAFLVRLETIKQHARESIDRYREAAGAVRRAREAYETALLQNGGGDLAQTLTASADGTFALTSLPAGDWVLVAAHTVFGKKASTHLLGGARAGGDRFVPQPKLLSHNYVTLWLRELTVPPGGEATLALTDRNAWLTGVVEDTETPIFRASPPLISPGTTSGGTAGAPPGTGGGTTGSGTLSPQR
jgi:hypothetical protein